MYLYSDALKNPTLWLAKSHQEVDALLSKLRLQESDKKKDDDYDRLHLNRLTLRMLSIFFPEGNFEEGVFLVDIPDKTGVHSLIKNAREYVLLNEMCCVGKMQKKTFPSGDYQFLEIPD